MTTEKFVLRCKTDGWFVAPGSKHTSDPAAAIPLDESELQEWLNAWGTGYESVKANEAKEVE